MASCKEKAKTESMTEPNCLELPIDLTKNILQRLDTVDIVTSARNVCPLWWNICKDPLMWRTIHMIGDIFRFDYRCLEKICRCGIDLSCGHLEDIAFESFGTDDLLKYISQRAGHIRRLQIKYCKEISCKGMREIVKEFPLLEELDIALKNDHSDKVTDHRFLRHIFSIVRCEDEEFPIPKTMPRLSRLKLSGILLKNVNFHAILDSCPLLESLDLRFACYYCYISRSVRKRCNKLKYFRPPRFSIDDLSITEDDDDGDSNNDDDDDYYNNCGLDPQLRDRLLQFLLHHPGH